MANDNSKLTPVCGHLEPDLNQAFDAWRRAQEKIPTVSKGVAYLMRLGLRSEACRQQSKPEDAESRWQPAPENARPAERGHRKQPKPETTITA